MENAAAELAEVLPCADIVSNSLRLNSKQAAHLKPLLVNPVTSASVRLKRVDWVPGEHWRQMIVENVDRKCFANSLPTATVYNDLPGMSRVRMWGRRVWRQQVLRGW